MAMRKRSPTKRIRWHKMNSIRGPGALRGEVFLGRKKTGEEFSIDRLDGGYREDGRVWALDFGRARPGINYTTLHMVDRYPSPEMAQQAAVVWLAHCGHVEQSGRCQIHDDCKENVILARACLANVMDKFGGRYINNGRADEFAEVLRKIGRKPS